MTNPEKMAPTNAAPASRYEISAQMTDAVQKVDELLVKRKSIDTKIDAGIVDAKAADVSFQAALEAQARAGANLALAIEDQDYLNCEKAAETAASVVEVAQRTKIRLERTIEALCRMAEETDQAIEEARVAFELERGLVAGDLAEALAADLCETMEPLIAVLLRAQAISSAVRHPGIDNFLSRVVVPDPRDNSGRHPLAGAGMVTANGQQVDVASASQEEPRAQLVAEALQPMAAIRTKLLGHRPFVHPKKRLVPYVIKGRSDGPTAELHAPPFFQLNSAAEMGMARVTWSQG